MKKILSLIGATTITTSGGAPLMAMMPNNSSNSTISFESINTSGVNKILKDELMTTIITEFPTQNTRRTITSYNFEPWVLYLSDNSMQQINQIYLHEENLNNNIIYIINFIISKLVENNEETNEFISLLRRNNEQFYILFFQSLNSLLLNEYESLFINNRSGLFFLIENNGNIKSVHSQT
ncbi:hypothetical protein [Spiroplasma citri]|uniref:Uncharacterized protein n=1 Tax=Spiroplasma citri TaxID=2133 RepID=A0AAJ4EKE1_SPICI|nr:hypothetical protein [Spiroplasma citri]APE75318.1 hypothetical protein SCITRI_001443 [Spiroplasma citri]QIA67547.1 hypothetical protein GMI18_07915 [Spiroplasma citri]QIA69394.1 hypothetical protein GL298_07825 [Spiroplasma citri]QIA71258.1 hypothetical protein GL981_07865 [Spiroplasma citri]QIA73365.1 hypothetical protein GL982_07000 [Spiroplasma citri]